MQRSLHANKIERTWTAIPSNILPGGLADILSSQHLQVMDGLMLQQPVDFLTSDGEVASVLFQNVGNREYKLTFANSESVKIRIAIACGRESQALAKLADILLRVPVAFRFQFRQVTVSEGSPASTRYSEFSKKLTIIGGLEAVNEDAFNEYL